MPVYNNDIDLKSHLKMLSFQVAFYFEIVETENVLMKKCKKCKRKCFLFGNLYDIISINKKYSNQDFESMLFGQNQKY